MWALVIGVSNYVHARPLKFAAEDAFEFSEFLKSLRGGGIPEDHIFTLLEDQATRWAVTTELDEMAKRVQPGDSVYVYIAGHGSLVNRSGYFIPSDGEFRNASSSGVHFRQITGMIQDGLAQANVRILVTDLCNSGRLGADPAAPIEQIANELNDEVLKLKTQGTFLNLMASGPTEASWERPALGHGVFTYSLLEALNGKASPGGRMVTARDLVDYLKAEVPRLTGFAQNPQVNVEFDPALPLSFPDLPGPVSKPNTSTAILVLENVNRGNYSRVEWFDARTQTKIVRPLPPDKQSTQIHFLSAGDFELRFYDNENVSRAVPIQLQPGPNTLDVSPMSDWKLKPVRTQLASLVMFPLPAPQTAAAPDTEAALMVRLNPGTDVFLDGSYFGSSQDPNAAFELSGVTPGVHQLRLVASPQREYRFRVSLFPGLHLLDIMTGELRFVVDAPLAPSQVPIPPGLPVTAQQAYRNFEVALWEDRLVLPRGDSAWDYYTAMRPLLAPDLRTRLERRLTVAMGNRAQRTLLKYLRGGDIRWNAAVFEEGSILVERAQQLFRRIPEIEAQKLFFDGRALIERGRYDDAITRLEQSTRIDPQAAHSLNAIGLGLWKQSLLNRAIPPLQQAMALTPQWNYPRNTLALIFVEQRRYDEAEAAFLSSIRNDPEDSTAYHGLAQLYLLLGRQSDAGGELQRALEFNPGNAYAYETRGRLRQIQGQLQQAEDDFRLAIRLEPEEPSFKVRLAELLRAQAARVGEAAALFAELGAQASDNIAVASALGRFYTDQNQFQQASTFLKKSIDESPADTNLRVLYGALLLQRNLFKNAERQFRAAVRRNPENAFAFYNLAVSDLHQKKFKDAQRAVDQAIRADPRFANPYQLKGQIHYAERHYEEAQQEYRRAFDLSIEPAQRQELCDLMVDAVQASLQGQIDSARNRVMRADYTQAWLIYTAATHDAVDAAGRIGTLCGDYLRADDLHDAILADVRDAVLEFDELHPLSAKPSELADAGLRDVVNSAFWKTQQRAQELWTHDPGQASQLFLGALETLDKTELQALAARSFNLRNEKRSIHQIIYAWGRRLLEKKDYSGAIHLMDVSVERRFFCVVSDEPIAIDSLMIPPGVGATGGCSDFEVAFHADRRAHEVYAAAYAGLGDMEKALAYLPALETSRIFVAQILRQERRWKDIVRLLEPRTASAELYLLLAEAQCQSGDCARGRETVMEGLRLFPKDRPMRQLLKQLR
jgi:tetratricopeptide (TPR) repeat protein